MRDFTAEAAALDAADPLAHYRAGFVDPGPEQLQVYFDGNSLGRPLQSAVAALEEFATSTWGGRLIRGWDEEWMDLPIVLGDLIGNVVTGAAPGQTFVGDSTTVLLYKLARAGVDAAAPGRDEIVLDTDNFPTDRYLLEGIAAERGLKLTWIDVDRSAGVTPEQVAAVVNERTALAVFSQVAYRSGWLADAAAITQIVHDAGALVLWDLCHSAGSVEIALDDWGADLAVGCTYKYLNGGPGSPAYGYVAQRHHGQLQQPIWGWMGRRDPFTMGPGYEPAPGVRQFISGTPPILAMVPLRDFLGVLGEIGMPAVRAKSLALTEFALAIADERLARLGVVVSSPRETERRGGHITLTRPHFKEVTARLWKQGVIPDYRDPDGIRIGLSPLSTSFAEVVAGMAALEAAITP